MTRVLISKNPEKYIEFVYVLTDAFRMDVINVFDTYDAAKEAGESWSKHFILEYDEDYGKRQFKVKEFVLKVKS